MILVWVKILVYTRTLILILTYNVTVIEKVSECILYHKCCYITFYDDPGTFCGMCRDVNKGVSALFNHCTTCSNVAGLLIVALSECILHNFI